MRKMLASQSDGNGSRKHLYTNVARVFDGATDVPYFQVAMDTWYYSESTLGKMALGDGPLRGAQGAGAFVTRQVAAFRDAFAGLFRLTAVHVSYKPRLTDVVVNAFHFAAPTPPEDQQAMETVLERSPYGIIGLWIPYNLRATVRDERGDLRPIWLPNAGQLSCHAHYTDGYISNLPRSVAVTHILTPSAKAGMAPWTADLHCNVISLFRRTNADVLARVRAQWQRWLQAHPGGPEQGDEDHEQEEGDNDASWEAYIVTLAEAPVGTPPDNQDLYERNAPHLREAIAKWEQATGHSFQWALSLDA